MSSFTGRRAEGHGRIIRRLGNGCLYAAAARSGGKMNNQKIFAMSFSKIYLLYIQKAERKNRTKEEVDEIICWLTGYNPENLQEQIGRNVSLETFFEEAPRMNPNAALIKGVVCGVRVEEIEDSLMQKVRWLDKLIDELAKGKKMEKILREG